MKRDESRRPESPTAPGAPIPPSLPREPASSGLACRGLAREPWLSGVDLDLPRGEIVVLRGASGSGKTLLARTLADLDPADAGEVSLDGEPREELPAREWRRRVVLVRQVPAALAETVGADLERVRALAGTPPDAPPPPEPLALAPDARTESLSGGEAQRLALARALAVSPDVLLLDEPTSALDPDRARAVEELLRAWVREGRAALWISHDADLARRLGAREVRLS